MSNDEMKRLAEVVRAIVKEENKPIIKVLDVTVKRLDITNKRIDEHVEETRAIKEKLEDTFEQVGELTVKIDGEIIPELQEHTKILKKLEAKSDKNSEDIKKLNKRLSAVEANDGIQPPIEHQIV